MIVKRIPAKPMGGYVVDARARHARQLVSYLLLPEKKDPYRDYLIEYFRARKHLPDMVAERLLHHGARNLNAKSLDGQRLEMMATAQRATRSPNPVDHWLLSWRAGEDPTKQQVEQVVDMFLDELGIPQAQTVFALHGDTHNRHVHLAINRYDPETDRVRQINNGFYRKAAHRAVAKIVDRFGRKPEIGARYSVNEHGAVERTKQSLQKEIRGDRNPHVSARGSEIRTGFKSTHRLAQELARSILEEAAAGRSGMSWIDLHSSLSKVGVAFEKKKNGAVVVIGDGAVKASSVSRNCSLGKLEAKLGAFVDRPELIEIQELDPAKKLLPLAHRAEEFRDGATHRIRKRVLATLQKEERPRIPHDLESFLQEQGDTWFADRWARREVEENGAITGIAGTHWTQPDEIDGYRARRMSDGVSYEHPDGWTAFTDRGPSIEVVPNRDDEALLAALRLAAAKFDHFQIKGNDQFRARARKLAIENGLGEHIIEAIPRIAAKGPAPKSRVHKGSARDIVRNDPRDDVAANHHPKLGESPEQPGRIARKEPSSDFPERALNWKVPDHRADPARIAHIESLVRDLKKERYLPLTWKVSQDGEGATNRTLHLDKNLSDKLDPRLSLFQSVEPFDEDPRIQAFFAENHRQMLEDAEIILRLQAGLGRDRILRGDFGHIGQSAGGLARSLVLMRETKEISDLLARLEKAWMHDAVARREHSTEGGIRSASDREMKKPFIRSKGPLTDGASPSGYTPEGKGAER